jgi:ankyrin repeat protein
MKKITAAIILSVLMASAHAEKDLILMAKTENGFTLDLLVALNNLPREKLNGARDTDGRSMLHWLASRSHAARGLPVLLAGGDVNAVDQEGRTPLFNAVTARDPYFKGTGDLMFMEMLTFKGADVNARDKGGTTPLMLAVDLSAHQKAAYLLRRGADPEPKDLRPEEEPLKKAQEKGDKRMEELLKNAIQARKQVEKEEASLDPKEIAKALTAADLGMVATYVRGGWDINEQNDKGQTALLRAVEAGRPDLVTELLFLGANPDIGDANGKTPLMASVRFLGIEGHRMTAMLLLKGANIEAKTKDGMTALTTAVSVGHDHGVMWLIAAGADTEAPTPKGPLIEYAEHMPTQYLLKRFGAPERKAKPEPETAEGRLFAALKRNDLEGVKKAVAEGAPVKAEDKNGCAMAWAATYGNFEIVDYLLDKGADINQQFSTTGWHVLHGLASWGPANGNPAVAASNIEQLLKRGAKVDIQSKDGTTPLMVAAKAGVKAANTEALIKAGADLTLRNKEGLTALGVAKKHGRTEMVEYLESLGAKE